MFRDGEKDVGEQEAGWVQPIDDRPSAVFLILIAAMVVTPIIAALLAASFRGSPLAPFAQGVGLLAQEAVLAGLTVWRLRRLGVSLSELRLLVDDLRVAWAGLLNGGGLLLVNVFGSQLSILIFHLFLGAERMADLIAREQGAVRRLLDPEIGPAAVGFMVFLAVGVAPFVEELFFRGYVYPVLKGRVGRHAVWMSALLFASVHLYLINFLPVFLIGVVLARLYERTGSLAAPIVAHATANAAVAILAMWAERLLA